MNNDIYYPWSRQFDTYLFYVCVGCTFRIKIGLASQPLLAFAASPPSEALPSHAGDGRGGDRGGGGSGQQASGEGQLSKL